jgi:hypothetical protein
MPKRVRWTGDAYRPITNLDRAKAVVLALKRAKANLRRAEHSDGSMLSPGSAGTVDPTGSGE